MKSLNKFLLKKHNRRLLIVVLKKNIQAADRNTYVLIHYASKLWLIFPLTAGMLEPQSLQAPKNSMPERPFCWKY